MERGRMILQIGYSEQDSQKKEPFKLNLNDKKEEATENQGEDIVAKETTKP